MAWRATRASREELESEAFCYSSIECDGKASSSVFLSAACFRFWLIPRADDVEIFREIHETRHELGHEQTFARQNYGRQREQNSTLEHLGLTEAEAVEYILMLSRDEAERRLLTEPREDHEVLLGELDEDVQTPVISHSSSLGSSSYNVSDPFMFGNRARVAPSSSMAKIQISPRLRPEPMEAGLASGSPLSRAGSTSGSLSSSYSSSRSMSQIHNQAPSPGDPDQFPSISSTPTKRSVSGSPQSVRSAWSAPLQSSPPQGGLIAGSSTVSRSPGVSLLSAKMATATVAEEDDEDLRYALELSLAEALGRSSGGTV